MKLEIQSLVPGARSPERSPEPAARASGSGAETAEQRSFCAGAGGRTGANVGRGAGTDDMVLDLEEAV
eukprot:COSAG04_NODE_31451_length_256_cov_1.649682_1_plen_67_part_10